MNNHIINIFLLTLCFLSVRQISGSMNSSYKREISRLSMSREFILSRFKNSSQRDSLYSDSEGEDYSSNFSNLSQYTVISRSDLSRFTTREVASISSIHLASWLCTTSFVSTAGICIGIKEKDLKQILRNGIIAGSAIGAILSTSASIKIAKIYKKNRSELYQDKDEEPASIAQLYTLYVLLNTIYGGMVGGSSALLSNIFL